MQNSLSMEKLLLSHFDAIIIGGGASGLMCALTAGQRGRSVLVLEASNKIGKKILISGGGNCNFTNLSIEPENYLSANPHFCKSALSRYTQWDFISMVEKHGIAYHEKKHGQLFCDHSARDILDMLLSECEQANVSIRTHCELNSVEALNGKEANPEKRFKLKTNSGDFTSHSLVIASGGLSIPKMGATGFGYEIAKQFSVPVKETRAALVAFTFSDAFKELSERLTGLSHGVRLGSVNMEFRENILFTHRGLSGPAVLQISNYWQLGDPIEINLIPDEKAETYLKGLKKEHPKSLLRNILTEKIPKKLVMELQTLFWSSWTDKIMTDIPDSVLNEIASKLAAWSIKPSGTEGYRTAEVTLGGVDTDYLSSRTMECKTQKGLYFIGEVVDVTGQLGGYNFQWAWSSAYAAGAVV